MQNNVPQRLLAVAAIVGTLALALTPIVASARQGASSTASNLRRVSFAALQYANDYDGGVVLTQQGDAGFDRTWPILLFPYLPDQKAYFDPRREVVTTPTVKLKGMNVLWSQVTTLGINDSGYSGSWSTVGKTCSGRKIAYQYGMRQLASMSDPDKRVAFAPTAYGDTGRGWSFFHAYDASWVRSNVSPSAFSWNNMVWSTQNLFSGKRIQVVRANGALGTISPEDFKPYSEKTPALALAAYCSWLDDEGKANWGSFVSND